MVKKLTTSIMINLTDNFLAKTEISSDVDVMRFCNTSQVEFKIKCCLLTRYMTFGFGIQII